MSNATTQGEHAEETLVIGADEAEEVVLAILRGHGVSSESAAIQARWLVEAELRGHPSHGLQRLDVLVARLDRGLAKPAADQASGIERLLRTGPRPLDRDALLLILQAAHRGTLIGLPSTSEEPAR